MPPAENSEAARQSIAEARCSREDNCGNVGADSNYASRDKCVEEVTQEWAQDLEALDCPGEINQDGLKQCLTEIRAEDCYNPIDRLTRYESCTIAQICTA
jgi:hypothetical protein